MPIQPAPEGTVAAPVERPFMEYATTERRGRFRWVILALVFLAITINYIDRQAMSLVYPHIREQYAISDSSYGHITAAFAWSYALGQMISGRVLDKIGTRAGYAIALAAWSITGALHALARGHWGFVFTRALFGISQSPAFPAATKTLAEWFPKKERAFAFGFVNSGANAGAIFAPMIVPWLVLTFGWQSAFIVPGVLGLLWIGLWLPLYRKPHEHPSVSPSELAHIESDPPEPAVTVRWLDLLTYRQTWAFAVGKFCTDPIWSFYLFWMPAFFKDRFGLDIKGVALPMITIYLIATVGSVAGGWLSSALIRKGWSINASRKTALLVSAVCVIPSVFISTLTNPWAAVLIAGLALAAHQSWSSNLYVTVPDMFPKPAVGSVAGLGGTWGYIGTFLFLTGTGYLLEWTNKNYLPIFLICGSAYLVALLIIHLLVPRMEVARLEERA